MAARIFLYFATCAVSIPDECEKNKLPQSCKPPNRHHIEHGLGAKVYIHSMRRTHTIAGTSLAFRKLISASV